jgi:hypothetical protein
MALTNNINAMELMKYGLEQKVKAQLTEDIVSDHMKQVEEEFRSKLLPLVESISIDLIELNKINDMNGFREEYNVYVKFRDGEKTNE